MVGVNLDHSCSLAPLCFLVNKYTSTHQLCNYRKKEKKELSFFGCSSGCVLGVYKLSADLLNGCYFEASSSCCRNTRHLWETFSCVVVVV